MWAMMPMFRVFSRGYCRSTAFVLSRHGEGGSSPPSRHVPPLPAIVREGLVGLRHLVRVLALLDCRPAVIAGVEQLPRELLGHAALGPAPGGADEPAHGQRGAAIGSDLDGDLIRRPADTPRLHL